jgi:hypothetical protein
MGFLPHLIKPKPLPGETLLQLVVRLFPDQWEGFVERMASEQGFSKTVHDRLLIGLYEESDKETEHKILDFVNYHMPTHWRTLESLISLQKKLKSRLSRPSGQVDLIEIIWPREQHSSENGFTENYVKERGVTLLSTVHGPARELDLNAALPSIQGEFVWLVPGGTNFMPSIVAGTLQRIIDYMTESPRRAFYADGAHSLILRASSLRELVNQGKIVPANYRDMARLLRERGFELAVNKEIILCVLEREYGGLGLGDVDELPDSKDTTPWWRKVSGR